MQPYLRPRCREAYSGHPIEVQANFAEIVLANVSIGRRQSVFMIRQFLKCEITCSIMQRVVDFLKGVIISIPT